MHRLEETNLRQDWHSVRRGVDWGTCRNCICIHPASYSCFGGWLAGTLSCVAQPGLFSRLSFHLSSWRLIY